MSAQRVVVHTPGMTPGQLVGLLATICGGLFMTFVYFIAVPLVIMITLLAAGVDAGSDVETCNPVNDAGQQVYCP